MLEKDVKYVPVKVLSELGIRSANEIIKVKNNPQQEKTLELIFPNDWWTAVSANMQLYLMEHPDDIRKRMFFREFHELACEIWHGENVALTLSNIQEGHDYLKGFIESR
jgi:hypothetical protein